MIDPKKPVVKGRASILTHDINIKCLYAPQLQKVIDWCQKKEVSFFYDVKTYYDDAAKREYTRYSVTIEDLPWAINLLELADVLLESDYYDEDHAQSIAAYKLANYRKQRDE